ncbi:MAG: hypothetical protein HUJ62_07185, partial [Streptococcus gallolyticus]|nr:hypothetical protein [Streptococcus gallolyticus]
MVKKTQLFSLLAISSILASHSLPVYSDIKSSLPEAVENVDLTDQEDSVEESVRQEKEPEDAPSETGATSTPEDDYTENNV